MNSPQFATLQAHGGRPADTRLEVNGININIFGQRQDSSYANFQDGNVQEYSFEISAHSAESETGGVLTILALRLRSASSRLAARRMIRRTWGRRWRASVTRACGWA